VTSTARLGLAGVCAFLLLFPLTLSRPGMPSHLKADEAAYYGMAQSLAHDGDLRFEQRDVDRFFTEFPYGPVNNLILMSGDGWKTVHYAKPFVYSLFAAPFARLAGARGILVFNTALLVAMIWMGTLYLRRFNEEGIAALYAAAFFLFSVGFVYVYWLQPEVFNMAAVTACLFFGLPREGAEEGLPRRRRELICAALSGAALALAVANKPMLALLGVAPLWSIWRDRRWRQVGAWLGGAAGCLALTAAVSMALTGRPTAYLAVQRGGFTLCGPGQMPIFPGVAAAPAGAAAPGADATPTTGAATSTSTATATATAPAATATSRATPSPSAPAGGAAAAIGESATGNSYSWLFRLPDTSPSEFADNVGYFLVGRHTGLVLYMPFAVVSVLLFIAHGRRSTSRWLLLGTSAAIALFFLLLIAWNWQGGGGFVGNRYFVNVYPAFLFLVTRVKPRAVVALGGALAGLCVSPLVLAPFGLPGPEPTLQMHVRGVPFRWFPLELTLRNVPGYHRVPLGDFRIVGRRDVFLPLGERMWVHGATPVELYLIADQPLGPLAFEVASAAPGNHVELTLGSWREELDLAEGESRRLVVPAPRPTRRWTIKSGALYAYHMVARTSSGRPRVWERGYPPAVCPGWPWQAKEPDSFFAGAELVYLGAPGDLEADLYHAEWSEVKAPARAHPGETFVVRARLRNTSAVAWRNRGGARVRLSYHWLDGAGATVEREGERTELARPLAAGGEATVGVRVVAPARRGRYVLALDPLFETVSWFSQRNGGKMRRIAIEVLPPEVATPEGRAAPEGR
jgi:hypothetical protein